MFKNRKKKKVDSLLQNNLRKKKDAVGQSLDEGIREYVIYLNSPFKVIFRNILVGMARGFGVILGMTVVVGIFIFIIDVLGGLPFIGDIFQWIGEEISAGAPATPTLGN